MELYNYKLKTDENILKNEDNIENRETGEATIGFLKEVEKAVWMLKNDKAPGVDNIPAVVLKHGGPGFVDALTDVHQKIRTSGQ